MSKFQDKINRVRQILNEDQAILSDPNSTEEEKLEALKNATAARRHRAGQSFRNQPAVRLPDRKSIEDEMTEAPEEKHGHKVAKDGYQEFSQHDVQIPNNLSYRSYNETNQGGMKSSLRIEESASVSPSMQLRDLFTEKQSRQVNDETQSIRRRSKNIGVSNTPLFESFERKDKEFSQEQLYVLACNLGILKESYNSTAGKWVVVSPYASPKTAEEVLYNQQGLSKRSARELTKDQQGNYGKKGMYGYEEIYPSYAPAKPELGTVGTQSYSAGSTSMESLKDPRRGDDYIRHNAIEKAKEEKKKEKTRMESYSHYINKTEVREFSEEVKQQERDAYQRHLDLLNSAVDELGGKGKKRKTWL